ncbi:unnamed protein product [Mytilus edulis]|uniref:Uncharacterized protein n=1 Tax=Mytilus edulis TaxID=6550 RepID=A0A8S3S9P0_MYTED|nr:unnamed protein product [Mytilus edulis]
MWREILQKLVDDDQASWNKFDAVPARLLDTINFPDHKPIDQIKDQLGDDGLLSVETSIIQHITTLLHSHDTIIVVDPKVYFTNPLPYLILSYQNKLAESDMAVCISNILVLNAGTFHSGVDLNADTKALIHYPTTIADVLTFSHTMMKPFLNICGGKTIQFVHPCLLTTSEIHMFNNDQRKGLKYMSMKTICKYINIPSKQSTKIQYGITVVDFLSKYEDLPLGVLSRALIGRCLNKSPLLLVIELEKRGADISYCDACFQMNISSNKSTDTNNDLHVCPLQAVIQSDNLHTFKYLLQKGAIIPHSKWC